MSEGAKNKSRQLGLAMTTALVVGNMIGSGIFLLPASLGSYGGISLVGWLFTSAGAIFLAIVFSRLSRILPEAGGPYAYTREGFGDFTGFMIAWGYWIGLWTGNAAIAVALVSYLGVFWPAVSSTPFLGAGVAIAIVWVFAAVNIKGVRSAGYVAVITTILKIIPLIAIALFGFFGLRAEHFTPFNLSDESAFSAISTTAALTLWAFLGLESATVPANNVQNPKRTIPRATIFGTLGAAVIYILATTAVMGTIPAQKLAGSTSPFADAASIMWGGWAGYFVAAGAVVSCIGALNGFQLLVGQVPLAAAQDGLFPAVFGRVSKNGTPAAGLVIGSVLISLLVIANFTKGLVDMFTFIILLATLTTLFPYVFCSVAELLISLKNKQNSFKENVGKILRVSIPAFLYSFWAIWGSGQDTVFWGILLLLAAIPFYIWIRWQKTKETAC